MIPVTNLKPLNAPLRNVHFKMHTMKKVINLLKPRHWAISLDLSDAYLHVPIFQKHRRFMRFCVANQCHQWRAMFFGPTCAPRIFTKLVTVVAAYLRIKNIRIVVYLDDWFNCESKSDKTAPISSGLPQCFSFTWFLDAHRKIKSGSKSSNHLLGWGEFFI